jgi:hypothetical protein
LISKKQSNNRDINIILCDETCPLTLSLTKLDRSLLASQHFRPPSPSIVLCVENDAHVFVTHDLSAIGLRGALDIYTSTPESSVHGQFDDAGLATRCIIDMDWIAINTVITHTHTHTHTHTKKTGRTTPCLPSWSSWLRYQYSRTEERDRPTSRRSVSGIKSIPVQRQG